MSEGTTTRIADSTSEAIGKAKAEIAFVTRKALVTFGPHNPLAIVHAGSVCFVNTAVIEYQDVAGDRRRDEVPKSFRVVGLADGKKLTKGLQVTMNGYGHPYAMVDLDEEDMQAF